MSDSLLISLIIVIVRLLVPFSVLRWPLGGVILNIIADAIDRPIVEHFGWGAFGDSTSYQALDKILDVWYMLFLLSVSRRWIDRLAREATPILFFWRLGGVIIAEITGAWYLLVFAPNIFEYFYIFWTLKLRLSPSFVITKQRLAIVLFSIGIPTIVHEALLHMVYPNVHLRLFDRFIFPWNW